MLVSPEKARALLVDGMKQLARENGFGVGILKHEYEPPTEHRKNL